MITAPLILALALTAQDQVTVAQSSDLATVKELYASASFEEALSKLSTLEDTVGIEQAEQYRALCLLGLGRTSEAQQSLERMIVANPLYIVPDTEVSPRLVAMFREVRRRMLPTAARDMYGDAKSNYDRKRYSQASAEFRELLQLLSDSDMGNQAESLSDLKMLAEGFLKLADETVAASRRAAEQQAAAAVASAPPSAVPAIYVAGDPGVTQAVEIERRMPAWNPPAAIARNEYHGLLEIVIDERGQVESAVMRRAAHAAYDPVLLTAAKKWRFQPATRNGLPVKYRKSFEIVLSQP